MVAKKDGPPEFHIGKNGPAECPATIRCRLKNEDGSPTEHFPTIERALLAYGEILVEQYGSGNSPKSKKSRFSDKDIAAFNRKLSKNKSQVKHHRSVSYSLSEALRSLTKEYSELNKTNKGDDEYTIELKEQIDTLKGYIDNQRRLMKNAQLRVEQLKKTNSELIKYDKEKRAAEKRAAEAKNRASIMASGASCGSMISRGSLSC